MSVVQQKAAGCAACGVAIQQGAEFCSESCRQAGRAFCKACGKSLIQDGHQRQFCSSRCNDRYARFGMELTPSVMKDWKRSSCKVCGEPMSQSKKGTKVFCSRKCYDVYRKAEQRNQDLAQKWGTYLPHTRKSLQEVESLIGFGAAQRLATAIDREYVQRKGPIPGKRAGYTTHKCLTCGKEFRRVQFTLRSKEYCSKKCLREGKRGLEPKRCWKLTWEQVNEIRSLYATGTIIQRELGEKYGVCSSSIRDIIKYRTWKPEHDPRRKAKLAQAQQTMQATGLTPGVPGASAPSGEPPAPGQPAGAQPPQGGQQQ